MLLKEWPIHGAPDVYVGVLVSLTVAMRRKSVSVQLNCVGSRSTESRARRFLMALVAPGSDTDLKASDWELKKSIIRRALVTSIEPFELQFQASQPVNSPSVLSRKNISCSVGSSDCTGTISENDSDLWLIQSPCSFGWIVTYPTASMLGAMPLLGLRALSKVASFCSLER